MANLIMTYDRKYGDCIQKIDVKFKARDKRPPLFGTMVFKSSIIPRMILGGNNEAKFTINGRTLWCKKYQARKNQRK